MSKFKDELQPTLMIKLHTSKAYKQTQLCINILTKTAAMQELILAFPFTNLFLHLIIFTTLLGSSGYLLKQTLSLDSKVAREQELT